MNIETKRPIIRDINIEDTQFFLALAINPNWIKYIGKKNINNLFDAKIYVSNLIRMCQKQQMSALVPLALQIDRG